MAFNVKDSIDIAAPAADVFRVATDYGSYPDWNPDMKKAEVLETDGEGRPTRVAFEVDARLKTVSYTLTYDYSEAPEAYSWELAEGDVKELRGSYRFDAFDDVTDVSYELVLDPGFPVPGFFRRQAEGQIKKAALEGLKRRVEGGR